CVFFKSFLVFFFSSRRRHTRFSRDWSSDVCSSDLFLESDEHEHDDAVQSFVFRSDKPFDPLKLEDFLSGLIQVYGPDMLRYKGVDRRASCRERGWRWVGGVAVERIGGQSIESKPRS